MRRRIAGGAGLYAPVVFYPGVYISPEVQHFSAAGSLDVGRTHAAEAQLCQALLGGVQYRGYIARRRRDGWRCDAHRSSWSWFVICKHDNTMRAAATICQPFETWGMLRQVTTDHTLTAVLAANARALRGSARIDDVVRAARYYDSSWNTSRIWSIEHGKTPATLSTLIVLALALSEVHDRDLTLSDLLASNENVALTKDLTVTGDVLTNFLRGGAIEVPVDKQLMSEAIQAALAALKLREDWPPRLRRIKRGLYMEVHADYGESEEYLARDLGLDKDRLIAEMCALWGRAFHVERDERAGDGVTKQKRGWVARTLKAELKAVLDGDDQ
jgi:hypothetical protein